MQEKLQATRATTTPSHTLTTSPVRGVLVSEPDRGCNAQDPQRQKHIKGQGA